MKMKFKTKMSIVLTIILMLPGISIGESFSKILGIWGWILGFTIPAIPFFVYVFNPILSKLLDPSLEWLMKDN